MSAPDDASIHRLAALGPGRRGRRERFDLHALAAATDVPVDVVDDPLPAAGRRRLEPLLVLLTEDAELVLLLTDPAGLRALAAVDLPPSILWGMRVLVVDAAEAAHPTADRPAQGGLPGCPVDWVAHAAGPAAQAWLARTVAERGGTPQLRS